MSSKPQASPRGEPLPEGLLWLLLTGEVPNKAQVDALSADLRARSELPDYVYKVLAAMPKGSHPMTQLSTAVLALQRESVFARKYEEGLHKSLYWEPTYEDALNLIAKLPAIAATIYRNTYHGGKLIPADPKLDWAGNLSHMMGFNSHGAMEMMRLYQTIHADHEGGNVSAHTCHVVGSALSDPYLSFSASMNGLAGPLHGLANQEVLRWLGELQRKLGADPSKDKLRDYIWDTLKSGKVVPGYGHAVLRRTDPRYTCQRVFAQKHLPDYPLFHLVSNLYEIVPDVLTQTGKARASGGDGWPAGPAAADAGIVPVSPSGQEPLAERGRPLGRPAAVLWDQGGELLHRPLRRVPGHRRPQHAGKGRWGRKPADARCARPLPLKDSIPIGPQVWSRALGLPIERPKSITMESLEKRAKAAHKKA